MSDVTITILAEDTAGPRGTIGEHGLAVWVEKDGRIALFDTGQGMALRPNATVLDLRLSEIETIVISHGHYDHTGGLIEAMACSSAAPVLLHPDAFLPKYAESNRQVGIPHLGDTELCHFIVTREPSQVVPGVWTTGEIPRVTDYEDTGGRFYRDSSCTNPDPLLDDQAVFLDSPRGTIVVLGCAHAGVVNTLERVRQLSGVEKIHAVLGGMHLLNASESRIEKTLDALEGLGVEVLCPCHCTGTAALHAMRPRFGNRLLECRTGSSFAF